MSDHNVSQSRLLTKSASELRIIVTGLIAQYPLGGVAWDYFQYVLGLARMGHDVYYIEDTGQWPYSPADGGLAKGGEYSAQYLADLMSRFGLDDRWAYRFPYAAPGSPQGDSTWFGMPDSRRAEITRTADLLINVSGTLQKPQEYRGARRLAYIDSDPVFTQLKLARGQADFRKLVDAHDVHFSFGESFSAATPETGHVWRPTRQPVVLSEWRPSTPARDVFTTVMNWTSYKPIEFRGKVYGQKDIEFRRFLDLPARVAPTVLELAVNEGKTSRTPRDLLIHKGWRLVDPAVVCPDFDSYRRYIESSRAEWSVAKNGYVEGQAGWFSCRSACYLAAGRPVVVQDTGFSRVLPVGQGLLPFTTFEEAVSAIQEVQAHYALHAEAARSLAEDHFDSRKVLADLVETAMNGQE